MPVSANAILSTPFVSNGKQVISKIWCPPDTKGVVVGGASVDDSFVSVEIVGMFSSSFLS